jgi:hypothetical protein
MAKKVPGRLNVVQVFDKPGRRTFSLRGHDPGNAGDHPGTFGPGFEKRDHRSFSLPPENAVHRSSGMPEHIPGDERGAVSAGKKKGVIQNPACFPHEIDHFRNIGQIVDRKPYRVRFPLRYQAKVILVVFHLKIDKTNIVTGVSRGCSKEFETERLQTQIDFRIHEGAGMNGEKSHGSSFEKQRSGLTGIGFSETCIRITTLFHLNIFFLAKS